MKWLIATFAATLAAQEPLSLRDAETRALTNHPRVAAAQLNARATAATVTQARAPLYPIISVNTTGTLAERHSVIAAGVLQTSALNNRGAAGFSVTQLITDFGRTAKVAESASLRRRAQEKDTEQTRSEIIFRVRQAYYQALAAQSVLRVAKETLEARRLTLRQVSALARSNLKSTLDVSFADVNVSEAELALYEAENQTRAAQAELSAAMGIAGGTVEFTLADDPTNEPLQGDMNEWITRAAQNRPELRGWELRIQAAERFAEGERRLRYPVINAIGAAGAIPTHEQNLPSSYSAAGINVSIPLLNGGVFNARYDEARLRAQALSQDAANRRIEIARNVRLAWLGARNAERRMEVAARIEEQAGRSLRLARSRYELGLSSILELTQAELRQTAALIDRSNARYQYLAQKAALEFEAGMLQ